MNVKENFMTLFKAPDFVQSYLHIFVTEKEMNLVLYMADKEFTLEEIADLFGEADPGVFLEQCYQREILNREEKDGKVFYRIGDFAQRLNNHAMYGNYFVLPRNIRKKLDQWCLSEYHKKHNYFQAVIENQPDYDNCHNDLIMLLHEAEEFVDASDEIMAVPCDCRMLADHCDRPREVCLRFNQSITDRTKGRSLTKEEAKQLLRMSDQEGLMHTGSPYNWHEVGPSVICNCCACCCYPFRAAQQFGTKGKWPKSSYLAHFNQEKCKLCGLCIQRCQFEACFFDGTERELNGKKEKNIGFNPELCWGCGLCANSCPSGAIAMEKIDKR